MALLHVRPARLVRLNKVVWSQRFVRVGRPRKMASLTRHFHFSRRIPLTNPRVTRLSLVARLSATSLPASRGVPAPGASVQGTRGPGPVEELVAAHADAVYRYALRLTRSRQQAEDLTQETLLRGWQRRG